MCEFCFSCFFFCLFWFLVSHQRAPSPIALNSFEHSGPSFLPETRVLAELHVNHEPSLCRLHHSSQPWNLKTCKHWIFFFLFTLNYKEKKPFVLSAAPFIANRFCWVKKCQSHMAAAQAVEDWIHLQLLLRSNPFFKSKPSSGLSAGVQASSWFSYLGPETRMFKTIVHWQMPVLFFFFCFSKKLDFLFAAVTDKWECLKKKKQEEEDKKLVQSWAASSQIETPPSWPSGWNVSQIDLKCPCGKDPAEIPPLDTHRAATEIPLPLAEAVAVGTRPPASVSCNTWTVQLLAKANQGPLVPNSAGPLNGETLATYHKSVLTRRLKPELIVYQVFFFPLLKAVFQGGWMRCPVWVTVFAQTWANLNALTLLFNHGYPGKDIKVLNRTEKPHLVLSWKSCLFGSGQSQATLFWFYCMSRKRNV